jgi:CubicO group peptidase (beta-lactamase class C family)
VTSIAERKVGELLTAAVVAGRFPGVVASWGLAGGPPSVCVEGRAEVQPTSRDVTADTWFDLASLTKPLVTTTLSLFAFRAGVMTPHSRVGEVLRECRGTPIADLDVHSLLTHTSGLPAWLPFYCLAEGRREKTPQVLERITLESEPGAQVVYSCVGFVVLGLMLEQLSGTRLDELFRRQVLVPTGLEGDLGFNPDPGRRRVAAGCLQPSAERRLVRELGLDPKWIPVIATGQPDDGNARFFGGAAGNAGLFGTARGARRLALEYAGYGTNLLEPVEVKPAVTTQTPGCRQERGYGWQIAATADCSAGAALSAAAFGHTGFTGVSVWTEPDRGAVRVLLTNRNHPSQRGVDLHPVRRRFHTLADCG